MEYIIQNLMKLKNLERTLSDLLDKIDKEIIQTDVEWLHLKNISEANVLTSTPASSGYPCQYKTFSNIMDPLQKNAAGSENVKKEIIDETINSVTLNLDSFEESTFRQGTDEEFDSD